MTHCGRLCLAALEERIDGVELEDDVEDVQELGEEESCRWIPPSGGQRMGGHT
jgi:hypothetical protein